MLVLMQHCSFVCACCFVLTGKVRFQAVRDLFLFPLLLSGQRFHEALTNIPIGIYYYNATTYIDCLHGHNWLL